MSVALKLFFALLALLALGLMLLIINKMHTSGLGFDSKRAIAEKIYSRIGGMSTRDLRYEEFIRNYPEGDNALYSDIKKLDVIDIDGLMSIL